MALRSFADSSGREWRVWSIVPTYESECDSGQYTPGLQGGWLCFEHQDQKRRLSPIPEDWEIAEAADLERYCTSAQPVRRRTLVG
ncbi:MAG TPA: hypothetical protein VF665_15935 [Longimicrobium sp.]|jgi:hypothetical protein|uniref:hypothetical protein n=1 Tax=Longimicrobium sp. TaxID=2029185 RepID=UPI002ED84859